MAKPRLVVRPQIKNAVQKLIRDKVVTTESEAVELLLHLCGPFLSIMLAQCRESLPINLDILRGAPTERVAGNESPATR